jgi:hypothetical protein
MNPFVTLLAGDSRSACGIRAALGGVAWLAGMAALQPGWGVALLLLAPLVVVPLGMPLLAEAVAGPAAGWVRYAAALQFPAALLLFAVAALPPGPAAAAFTLPWLALTLLLGLAGLSRLRVRPPCAVEDWCVLAALLYPAVGGGWLVLSALGARPLDFPTEIVRATATHFHYAGFVLPLLAVLLVRRSGNTLARLAALGVVVGVPLVAAGITLSAFGIRLPEWLAAWFLAAASMILAILQCRLALCWHRPAPRLLLAISGLSLLGGMVLAAVYALGSYLDAGWLDVPLMLRTHGVVNAFGFALPGLLGWILAAPDASRDPEKKSYAAPSRPRQYDTESTTP